MSSLQKTEAQEDQDLFLYIHDIVIEKEFPFWLVVEGLESPYFHHPVSQHVYYSKEIY